MRRQLFAILISLATLACIFSQRVNAESPDGTTMEAKVVWIIESRPPYQKLRLEITSGAEKGKQIEYQNDQLPMAQAQTYAVGDGVILGKTGTGDGDDDYFIMDQIRRPALYTLAGLFIVITLLIAKRRAIQALLALGISFGVIFKVVLPLILSGNDPIFVSILASIIIIPVTFYISHGINHKTHTAVLGTLIALVVTAIVASLFVNTTRLTGFASEEATFLQVTKGKSINIKGLLLAGIIIGVLGILDDITISQAALVQELHQTDPKLTRKKLYTKAMNVGTDHISSMINTLVLVYTGAAMPLLLLFLDSPHPINEIINYEIVAEEIVRMLVGSIGLVIAVPITTFLATLRVKKSSTILKN